MFDWNRALDRVNWWLGVIVAISMIGLCFYGIYLIGRLPH